MEEEPNSSRIKSCRSPTSSIEFDELNDPCLDPDLEDDLENLTTTTKQPHFLDYAYTSPTGFDENLPKTEINTTEVTRNDILIVSMKKAESEFSEQSTSGTIRGVEDYSQFKNKFQPNKEPSYSLPRFTEQDTSTLNNRSTWPIIRSGDIKGASKRLGEFEPKIECVYSLLSMLGSHDSMETASKFLELSKTRDSCIALRRSGCIPLLVQIMHSDVDDIARKKAGTALHNVIHCHPDDKVGRREAKVLRLMEQIIEFCENLKKTNDENLLIAEKHPSQAICSLMKLSFDEDHRHSMGQLGALHAIANLVFMDHSAHGSKSNDQKCISLRRYAGMSLTNLTFGDGNNKAQLCSNKKFMKSLVAQLESSADDLLQVTASVLRNLSWRADNNMKLVLNEIGTVTALTKAAMVNKNENTLKAILSALWNLSAHCSTNKTEFCKVEGALAFLVDTLNFDAPSKTLNVVENAGGILRNVSSHIAVTEEYRKILRQRNCLGILLQQLRSESLTVVSNACGTLWNLSARCPEDQKYLCENGAIPMLRSLVHSKHKMISNGSNAALKNLINYKPIEFNANSLDPIAKALGFKELPSLNVRKQRALVQELEQQNLTETFENLDHTTPSKEEKNNSWDENRFIPESSNCFNYKIPNSVDEQQKNCDEINLSPSNNKNNQSENYDLEEQENDQIIDYSVKYNVEDSSRKLEKSSTKEKEEDDEEEPIPYSRYQETDLDQITNYSLRYAENQTDVADKNSTNVYEGNEMMLALDDTVKCYQTEGTPYVISNATSMSDLRQNKDVEKNKLKSKIPSGINTPDKPINYCDEGTPGYFSRFDSLSSLDELEPNDSNIRIKTLVEVTNENEVTLDDIKQQQHQQQQQKQHKQPMTILNEESDQLTNLEDSLHKAVTFSEQPTPLMFSRHSSIESLASAEPDCVDDKSSIVSDFSRLASGLMSPSELPDSPTQTMPQSPRRSISNNIVTSSPHIEHEQVTRNSTNRQDSNLIKKFEDDNVHAYIVENTPCNFSSATSLSNLSIEEDDDDLKINDTVADELLFDACINIGINSVTKNNFTQNKQQSVEKICNLNDTILSDDSSDGSDIGNDQLLEQCIRDGMQKSKSKDELMNLSKENPIGMMRNSLLHSKYTGNNDEMNKFQVEDSPCNFSNISVLSNLTIDSAVATNQRPDSNSMQFVNHRADVNHDSDNHSISSISNHSDDDNVLNQAISAGSKTKSVIRATTQNIEKIAEPEQIDLNDSFSSIESNDSADQQQNSLLQQCINSGMRKDISKVPSTTTAAATTTAATERKSNIPQQIPQQSPKRYLNSTKQHSNDVLDSPSKNRERRDQQLLWECINTGMSKSITNSTTNVNLPKNGVTTSAVVLDQLNVYNIAPGVVEPVQNDIKQLRNGQQQNITSMTKDGFDSCVGSNENLFSENIFDCSNLDVSNDFIENDDSNIDMDVSNEFLIENSDFIDLDRQKDPNLMVKSIDRLTQKLVSQAEFLRINANQASNQLLNERKASVVSNSNNTWNDDTYSNDISFPSISLTAPVIQSIKDETTSDFKPEIIDFKVGGQIQQQQTIGSKNLFFNNLNSFPHLTDSSNSLDLENVGPPSGMDSCLSMSGLYETICPSKSKRKLFAPGLLARRALGGGGHAPISGSLDSINSCFNLDNVNPPSIMDELLDSMISVASITSEIADESTLMEDNNSQYDTSQSEIEDLTEYQSCNDLSINDFSFSEQLTFNIPRKITPKQKRQMVKDRFKTYTIMDEIQLQQRNDEIVEITPISPIIIVEQKLTPRQKRQADTARFQTQVLDSSSIINVLSDQKLLSDHESEENDEHLQLLKLAALSIVKTTPEKIVEPQPIKSIRGGKKPAYVSPYKLTKPTISKLKPKVEVKQQVKVAVKAKETGLKKFLPKKLETTGAVTKKPVLERQGTFVKEDGPSNSDVPIVVSEPTTPSKSSRLPTKIGSPKKINTSNIKAPQFKSTPTPPPPSKLQKHRTLGSIKSPSVPAFPANTSAVSSTTATKDKEKKNSPGGLPRSKSNIIPVKTNITSRISGLWKKPEVKTLTNGKSETKVNVRTSFSRLTGINLKNGSSSIPCKTITK